MKIKKIDNKDEYFYLINNLTCNLKSDLQKLLTKDYLSNKLYRDNNNRISSIIDNHVFLALKEIYKVGISKSFDYLLKQVQKIIPLDNNENDLETLVLQSLFCRLVDDYPYVHKARLKDQEAIKELKKRRFYGSRKLKLVYDLQGKKEVTRYVDEMNYSEISKYYKMGFKGVGFEDES